MSSRVVTNEDWAPTFLGGFLGIRVHLHKLRVVIYGADDMGYERNCRSESELFAVLRRVPTFIQRAELISQGWRHW